MFCREEADHFPTMSDALVWPYFSEPPVRGGQVLSVM
jgi:hypothetical protein